MDKMVLLFPGQGSQYVGMGKDLADGFLVARQTFEEANDLLGFDLRKICFEGSLLLLSEAENLLPAMLCVSIAAFRVYMQEIGIAPEFCAGHSLGEIAALTCSGAVQFADAVKIARERGKLAQRVKGSMTVLSMIDIENVENECRKISDAKQNVVIACYNSRDQVLVSGDEGAVTRLEDKVLEQEDAQVTPLMKSIPFHSPLMNPVAEELRSEMQKYRFHNFNWKVISNVTALPYEGPEKITQNFVLQINHPVQWQKTMEYLRTSGVTAAVELGPKTVLRDLIKSQIKEIQAFSYDLPRDVSELSRLASFKKGETAGKSERTDHAAFFTKCIAAAVCVKNRNWDNEQYQKGVVEPYRQLERLQNEFEAQKEAPSTERMQEALELLHTIFITKATPIDKQISRLNRILSETGTEELFANLRSHWQTTKV